MVNWILVAVLVVLVIIISIKFKELGHKTKLTAVLILLAVLLGTVGYVWFRARPDLTTYQGFVSLGRAYFMWVGSLFGNMGSITGYAVKQDWGVGNLTSALT